MKNKDDNQITLTNICVNLNIKLIYVLKILINAHPGDKRLN